MSFQRNIDAAEINISELMNELARQDYNMEFCPVLQYGILSCLASSFIYYVNIVHCIVEVIVSKWFKNAYSLSA